MENPNYQAGDIVYVFYRNPHTQDVANIQAAAVVNNPEKVDELALFLYENYYPLSSEMAVYSTEEDTIICFSGGWMLNYLLILPLSLSIIVLQSLQRK